MGASLLPSFLFFFVRPGKTLLRREESVLRPFCAPLMHFTFLLLPSFALVIFVTRSDIPCPFSPSSPGFSQFFPSSLSLCFFRIFCVSSFSRILPLIFSLLHCLMWYSSAILPTSPVVSPQPRFSFFISSPSPFSISSSFSTSSASFFLLPLFGYFLSLSLSVSSSSVPPSLSFASRSSSSSISLRASPPPSLISHNSSSLFVFPPLPVSTRGKGALLRLFLLKIPKSPFTFFLLYFLFSASPVVKPAHATKALLLLQQPHAESLSHLHVRQQQDAQHQQQGPQQRQQQRLEQQQQQQQQVLKCQQQQVTKLLQQSHLQKRKQHESFSGEQHGLRLPTERPSSAGQQQQKSQQQKNRQQQQKHQQRIAPHRSERLRLFFIPKKERQQQIYERQNVSKQIRQEQQQKLETGLPRQQQPAVAALQQVCSRCRLLVSHCGQQEQQQPFLPDQHCRDSRMQRQSPLFLQQQKALLYEWQHQKHQKHLSLFQAQQQKQPVRDSGDEQQRQLQQQQLPKNKENQRLQQKRGGFQVGRRLSQSQQRQQQQPHLYLGRRNWPAAAVRCETDIEGASAAAAGKIPGKRSISSFREQSKTALCSSESSNSSSSSSGTNACNRSSRYTGKVLRVVKQFSRGRTCFFPVPLFFLSSGMCSCRGSVSGAGLTCCCSSSRRWPHSSRSNSIVRQQGCHDRSSSTAERRTSLPLCERREEAPTSVPLLCQNPNNAAFSFRIRNSRAAAATSLGGTGGSRLQLEAASAAAPSSAVHASVKTIVFPPIAVAAGSTGAAASYAATTSISPNDAALAAAIDCNAASAGGGTGAAAAAAALQRGSASGWPSANYGSRAAAAAKTQNRCKPFVAAAATAATQAVPADNIPAGVTGRKGPRKPRPFQEGAGAPAAPAAHPLQQREQQQQQLEERRQAKAAATKGEGQETASSVAATAAAAAAEEGTSAVVAAGKERNNLLKREAKRGRGGEERDAGKENLHGFHRQERREEKEVEEEEPMRKLLHVRLRVKNLEKMVRFYKEVLKMEVIGYAHRPAQPRSPALPPSAATEEEAAAAGTGTGGGRGWRGVEGESGTAAAAASWQGPFAREEELGETHSSSNSSSSEDRGRDFSLEEGRRGSAETPAGATVINSRRGGSRSPQEEQEAATAVSEYTRRSYLLPPHTFSHDRRDVVKEAESLAAVRAAVEAAEKAGPTTLVLLGYPPPAWEKHLHAATADSPVAAASAAVESTETPPGTTSREGSGATAAAALPRPPSAAAASCAKAPCRLPASAAAAALPAELQSYFLNSLKIELSYTPAAARLMEQQVDAPTTAAEETEQQQLLLQLKQHMQGLCRDLPALNRAREFERKRNRLDRQCHGFIGFSCALPSLLHLSPAAVAAAGGRLYQLPAKRKVVPSMIPDEHARKDIWVTSAYLVDPEGNGIEVQQQTGSSSISLSPEKALQHLGSLRSWEAYMQDQERDIRKEELKQQIILLQQHLQQQRQRGEQRLTRTKNGTAIGEKHGEKTQKEKQAADTGEKDKQETEEDGKDHQQANRRKKEKRGNQLKQQELLSQQTSGAEQRGEAKDQTAQLEHGREETETTKKKKEQQEEEKQQHEAEQKEEGKRDVVGDAEEEAERLRVALGIKLVDKPKSMEEQLLLFKEALRVMEEKEKRVPTQKYVPLRMPQTPRLQKVRFYTGRMLSADRFYVRQLKMKVLRYKSHLFERLYPWSRFAAVSKTFACRQSLRKTAAVHPTVESIAEGGAARTAAEAAAAGEEGAATAAGVEAAAAAGVKEFAAMEKFAQEGDGSSIPAEWESESSTNPAAAATKVYLAEAAERQLPQLECVYAYDEDVIRIHPCFGYVTVGVEDVLEAVATCHANAPRKRERKKKKPEEDEDGEDAEDEDGDEEDEEDAAAEEEEEALATSPCVGEQRPPRQPTAITGAAADTCFCSSSSSTSRSAQIAEEEAATRALREKLEKFGVHRDSAVVFDRDGYPIQLMSLETARRHYEMLYRNLMAHRLLMARAVGNTPSQESTAETKKNAAHLGSGETLREQYREQE